MQDAEPFLFQWPYLLRFIPEFEQSALALGALRRRRNVRSPADLLRLALVYGYCDLSLRETAAWAASNQLADVSDVALLKRFRHCDAWLGHLVACKIAERSQWRDGSLGSLRVKLVDASAVSAPGSPGTDWRVHLGFDLRRMGITDLELTDARGGESLQRLRIAADELLVADRGYARGADLLAVARAKARFLVRLPWRNVPLVNPDGSPWDMMAFLRSIPDATCVDVAVGLPDAGTNLPCRLLAVRKTEPAAEQSRKKALQEYRRKSRAVDPRTLEAAGYTFLLTNLPAERLSAEQGLELYRYRWQIELAFKRMKSLLDFDLLRAREPPLARTYLFAKLLGALLIDDLTQRHLDFSPWGYPVRAPENLAVANPACIS